MTKESVERDRETEKENFKRRLIAAEAGAMSTVFDSLPLYRELTLRGTCVRPSKYRLSSEEKKRSRWIQLLERRRRRRRPASSR